MVEIRLTATRLVADGDQLYSIASALRTGIASADGTLSGFSGMAGNDNLGEALAEGYDSRAEIYLRNAHAIMANVGALDGILCATGAAYDDVQSLGSGGSGSSIVVPSFSEGPQPSLPSALGGSWEGNFGPIDLGVAQEAIEDALTALGLAYPNANVDQLTAAATAFSLLEADLRRASSSLSSALTAASSMDLPQWPTIDGTRSDLVRLLDERVEECVEMQNFINGALGQIDQAKQDFALNLGQLVLEIALDLGITAALTLVTGPLGAALGSVKILATIAKWVNRIRESILAARLAIIALREALKGAAVSAASAAGASAVFDGMVRGQWDRVGVAALSSAAGGFVGGPISHAISGGSRGIIRNALAGGGGGAFDGAASELVASSLEDRDFNLLAGAGMGVLTGTAGGAGGQAVTNALPNRANVGGNVATPQVHAGTNDGRSQPVSAGGGRPGADAAANAPQPGPAAASAAAAAAGGAAPRTDSSAPQPGAGTGGGGSQPAGGGAPPIDDSAPQPGAGDPGSSQPAPGGAPDVPNGEVPISELPAGGTAAASPVDGPAAQAPAAGVPETPTTNAPPMEAPVTPPAEAPAAVASPVEAPVTPPEASTTDATPAEAPAAPQTEAPATDATPADATVAGIDRTEGGTTNQARPAVPAGPAAGPSQTPDTDGTADPTPEPAQNGTVDQASTTVDQVDGAASDSAVDAGAVPPPEGPQGHDQPEDAAGEAQRPHLTDEEFDALDPQAQYDYAMGEVAAGARTFPDNDAAIAYGREHWADVQSTLSQGQQDATFDYTRELPGDSGITYREINAALRSGPPYPAEVQAHIDLIDAGMNRFALSEDLVITRGTGVGHWSVTPEEAAGTTFDEASYLSTSLGGVAGAFDGKGAILHIAVPQGTPAMWVESVSDFGVGERELLLGRGLQWEATRSVMLDGQWHVFGRVVR